MNIPWELAGECDRLWGATEAVFGAYEEWVQAAGPLDIVATDRLILALIDYKIELSS